MDWSIQKVYLYYFRCSGILYYYLCWYILLGSCLQSENTYRKQCSTRSSATNTSSRNQWSTSSSATNTSSQGGGKYTSPSLKVKTTEKTSTLSRLNFYSIKIINLYSFKSGYLYRNTCTHFFSMIVCMALFISPPTVWFSTRLIDILFSSCIIKLSCNHRTDNLSSSGRCIIPWYIPIIIRCRSIVDFHI